MPVLPQVAAAMGTVDAVAPAGVEVAVAVAVAAGVEEGIN